MHMSRNVYRIVTGKRLESS